MSEEVDRGLRLRNPGYVYVLKSGKVIKVGLSKDPATRVDTLNRKAYCGRANWVLLNFFETNWMLQVEQRVHMDLWDYMVQREVFNCSVDLAEESIVRNIAHLDKRFSADV